MDLKKNT